ncbi:hypothetical protein C450_18273 [Halococcus salifodinae DSM 8989]|uniref:Uncharacterized protein n=2 Tax=Halococcaceae TaxID=1963270 RepID=M0MUD2_9EURY|nr:hypothetical protein C450_18273 [Halococcus salifodinae DSM 8989]
MSISPTRPASDPRTSTTETIGDRERSSRRPRIYFVPDGDDGMVDPELGRATIVYDKLDEGQVEITVDNEYIAYFDDHWLVKVGEDDDGNDVVRRIPRDRVQHVERSVEKFQDKLDMMADEARERLPF